MSKAVKTDTKPNKEELQELTLKAINGLQLKEYAKKSGVSEAVLSRLIHKKQIGTPTPTTLIKIARASNNIVTNDAMLRAGGFDPVKYTNAQDKIPENQYIGYCNTLLNNLLSSLTNRKWVFFGYGNNSLYNFCGEISEITAPYRADEPFGPTPPDSAFMHFKILHVDTNNLQMLRKKIEAIYGSLSVARFHSPFCYTIVTNSQELYDLVLGDEAPIHLNVKLQIILTNEKGTEILKDAFPQSSSDCAEELFKICT